MGELLFELLILFFDLFGELLLELVAEGLLDGFLRAISKLVKQTISIEPVRAAIVYALLGAAIGGLSVYFFPHPLVRPGPVHGTSLVVAPVITGLVMSRIGSALRQRGKSVAQIESFGCGFAFAFGMALMRFLLVK